MPKPVIEHRIFRLPGALPIELSGLDTGDSLVRVFIAHGHHYHLPGLAWLHDGRLHRVLNTSRAATITFLAGVDFAVATTPN